MGVGVIVDSESVGVDVVELNEFGGILGGGGHPDMEITEPGNPFKTYSSLSLMVWSVQVVSVFCGVDGGVIVSPFLVLSVFLVQVVVERKGG